jgi:hypothetical protein
MLDRRIETRMLCADLVAIRWRDAGGRTHRAVANLEDISSSGACIQLEQPIPLKSRVKITYPKGELAGVVRYCVYREIGYFIGIEFGEGCRWTQKDYVPQHMLDPRKLLQRLSQREETGT